MHHSLSNIKAVGVDLDKTLYRDTPEMKDLVFKEIADKILKARPELISLENVYALYGDRKVHHELGSWSKLIELAGVDNPAETAKKCVASAKITNLIERDPDLANIIKDLSKKYFLFIITGSDRTFGYAKLKKIGIDPSLFKFSLYGDDPNFAPKTSPDSFRYFLSQSPYRPNEHIYIGDNPKADIQIPKSLGFKTIVIGPACEDADFSVARIHQIKKLLL